MKRGLLTFIIPIVIFIGCGDNKRETVRINQIEKSITKKKTNLGCEGKDIESDECKERESSSAKFILNTLEKDLDNQVKEDIVSIKKNLNISLQEITEEEKKKNELKNSLIALVDEVDNQSSSKAKRIENFIDSIDEKELGLSNSKKIASIKSKLRDLVELDSTDVKPQEVKKKLKTLIADITEAKKSLFQTGKSLKRLVENVEKQNTPSAKKFANAIIKDVADKKISIIDENEKYYIIKVQHGDNLSILAKRYYNDRNKFKLIYDANRDKINSKYEIYPNSRLLIPKI